jgi:hypothetical protein
MAHVLNDNFMVCTECLMVIANDDYSMLDYYYSPEDAEKRAEEIREGMVSIVGYIVPGDNEFDEEFSKEPCECCGELLAGTRHHCIVLGD